MRRRRNVKVLATLGPATSTYERIRALFEAGADCFRLNMSHGAQDDIAARHALIRQVETDIGRPIGIVADLQGPKLRVGVFGGDAPELETGAEFRFDLDETPGDVNRVCLPHPEIFAALKKGDTLLVNDGKIRLHVLDVGTDHARTRVDVGGTISDRKGVNVPDTVLPLAALTTKDRDDLEFACKLGVDWIALSFVQRADDVEEARRLIAGRAAVMAKIEKPAAVKALGEILAVSDGVMVARGDLGVELPLPQVPPTQKRIVRAARAAGKPVVVATQMLESMIEAPVPTRAEVTDVSNAIFEGADAIMLSAESAVGAYPVEAVGMMDAIAQTIEADNTYRPIIDAAQMPGGNSVPDAIVAAARQIAESAAIDVICTFTDSGSSARLAARERPRVPILAVTPRIETARSLCLVWGLHSMQSDREPTRFRDCVEMSVELAQRDHFAAPGGKVVVVAGVPYGTSGTTNILRVATITRSGKARALDT